MPKLQLLSTTVTGTTTGPAVAVPSGVKRASIFLRAASFGGTVNPSITVQTQTSADGGTNWITIAQQAIVENGVQVIGMPQFLPPGHLYELVRSNVSATAGTAETAVVLHEIHFEV